MQKVYNRINWENYPSENTPLNESNLNRIDYATNEIDDRVISLDTTKADNTDIAYLVESITLDDSTGIITITKHNGAEVQIPTTINKVAVNFRYDYATQSLVLTLTDGSTETISLATLIQNNEFANTDTVAMSVSGAGMVTANIVQGSIKDSHLRTDYLADIRLAEANAAASASSSDSRALDSEAWAVGKRDNSPVQEGDETYNNNSKYYSQVANSIRSAMIDIRDDAAALLEAATNRLTGLNLMINYADGCLYYDINSGVSFNVDSSTGQLQYEVIV